MARRGCLRRGQYLGPSSARAETIWGFAGRAPRSAEGALQIRCPAEISHVTVHARGAVITRTIPAASFVERPSGPSEEAIAAEEQLTLLIPDITPLADPGSLRAALISDGRTERQVVSIRSTLVVPETPTSPGPAAAEVDALAHRMTRLATEIDRLHAQRNRLVETAPDPALRTTSFVDKVSARMADALATAGLLLESQQQIDRRLEELSRELAATRLAHRAAEAAYEQASSRQRTGPEHPTRAAVITLAGRGPIPTLRLSYVVTAARFWPLYTLRISESSDGQRRGTWLLEVLLAQRSGEDWTQARISVSTADLLLDTRLPELPSLRFGRAQAPPRRGYRPPPAGLEALFQGYDATFAGKAPPAAETAADGILAPSAATPIEDLRIEPPLMLSESDISGSQGFDEEEEAAAPPPMKAAAKRKRAAPPRNRAELESPKDSAAAYAELAPESQMSVGAPPPPPAPSAAAPKGRSLGGLMRGGGPGGADYLKKSVAMDVGGGGGYGEAEGGGMDDDGGADASTSETSEQWLDFDRLSLASAHDRTHRGRLVPRPDTDGQRLRSHAAGEIERLQLGSQYIDPLHHRGQFDHRYDSDGLVRVPSDGTAHRILLRSVDCAPGMRLLTVPREQPEVYREAELRNPLSAPLLAGPVDVYVEGSLLTTAPVAAIDRGGSLRVGMGVEDRVRVARNVRSDEETTGLLGGSTQVTHHVSIELSSALGQAVTVEVYDRLPVSDDKSVTIDLLAARPEAKEYTQAERGIPIRGGLLWSLPLPAGGKAKVDYSYRIVFPAKSEIVGGNRRD